MVSSRIINIPEDDITDTMLPIPEMMFAAGEEPVGVRVLTYQFSLCEFTIVTVLNSGEFPKRAKAKSKMKMNINEKPYWPELFGKAEDLRVSTTLKMLRRKTITENKCDEDEDLTHKKTKKQTLSSGHVREVDKKTDVLVRSIIPEDPDQPIVAANLVWADKVVVVKVDNLLKLITQRHLFIVEMFKRWRYQTGC
ncbi:hypothetical protein IGI04_040587 [Brassica rapa subsp. trilocularis]|uniref:DUF1985 domain-containing protein n=1 Tax=Brassica rapa subsp. trilocularis TaxID=1813537 RepID=A0ABQ7KL27_BRACM|nr:hypothetical protein IGI04_039510 [Brassica rapa subsp. trilocularis]KAG5375991.1 hypothetical protein IGI04_040587 [Brassica rapa subsp. trilocularis]